MHDSTLPQQALGAAYHVLGHRRVVADHWSDSPQQVHAIAYGRDVGERIDIRLRPIFRDQSRSRTGLGIDRDGAHVEFLRGMGD